MKIVSAYNSSLGSGQKFTTPQELNNRLNRNKVIDHKITSFCTSFLWSFFKLKGGDYIANIHIR